MSQTENDCDETAASEEEHEVVHVSEVALPVHNFAVQNVVESHVLHVEIGVFLLTATHAQHVY